MDHRKGRDRWDAGKDRKQGHRWVKGRMRHKGRERKEWDIVECEMEQLRLEREEERGKETEAVKTKKK